MKQLREAFKRDRVSVLVWIAIALNALSVIFSLSAAHFDQALTNAGCIVFLLLVLYVRKRVQERK
jgi:hypothetical protein